MTARVKVRVVRLPQRPAIAPADDWERFGRNHFLTRDAFERCRRPATGSRRGWLSRLFHGR